jgi:peptidoglycan/LPS O-acetylase OafA/YrhL
VTESKQSIAVTMTSATNELRCEPPAARSAEGERAQLLDALRGIAVLAVIALHSGANALGHGSHWFEAWVWPVLSHGYLGVQLFFVISGYCIQGALESAQRNAHPLRSFTLRRLRRIYPPYWMSLLLVIALAMGTMLVARKSWFSIFPLTMTDWLLNLMLLQGPFQAPDAALVYWSLSIEVQFYLLMGIGLVWGKRSSFWMLFLSVLYLVWVIRPGIGISGTALAYWPEFACGIAAYHAHHHGISGRRFAVALWSLTFASATMGLLHGVPIVAATGELSTPFKQFFCLLCGLFLWLGLSFPRPNSSMASRCLSSVGVISYSLYLTHEPLGSRVFNLGSRFINLDHGGWIPLMIAAWLVTFFGGYLFYRWCERPWLNRRTEPADAKTRPQPALVPPLQVEMVP